MTMLLDREAVKPVARDTNGDSEPYVKQHISELAAEIGARRKPESRTERPQADLDRDMKERLNRRALKALALRTGRILLWVTLIVALLAFAGAALYVNKDKLVTSYDKYGMDTRPCMGKVGERTITGTRTYGYRYMTVLGYKIYMTPEKEVEQETRLDISGNGMTILGMQADGTLQKTMISDGERYRQLLHPADSYTFFMDGGKNTAVIAYTDLCK